MGSHDGLIIKTECDGEMKAYEKKLEKTMFVLFFAAIFDIIKKKHAVFPLFLPDMIYYTIKRGK